MERLAVIFSFILIFAFNSIDNAISPLASQLGHYFAVSPERALWLISVCTGGTVVGLIFGPALVNRFSARRLLGVTLLLMVGSQVAFAFSSSFMPALMWRAVSGLSAGLVASVMWQLTFHGVSSAYFPAMIAVLMSARPLAVALGVPAAGLAASEYSWQLPILIIAALTGIGGVMLFGVYPRHYSGLGAGDTQEKTAEAAAPSQESWLAAIINPYISALSVPYASVYYLGTTINRIAYFGFYSFCGLWFAHHYGLNLKSISFALLVIGLAECLVNFSTGKIIAKFGHKRTFLISLGASFIVLPLFLYGWLPLKAAIAVISLFMLLDRVYSMALVISVPQMFPSTGDKTAFGSLNTLTSWGAMTIISWVQGAFMESWGIVSMESLSLACFVIGSFMLIWVQKETVFKSSL